MALFGSTMPKNIPRRITLNETKKFLKEYINRSPSRQTLKDIQKATPTSKFKLREIQSKLMFGGGQATITRKQFLDYVRAVEEKLKGNIGRPGKLTVTFKYRGKTPEKVVEDYFGAVKEKEKKTKGETEKSTLQKRKERVLDRLKKERRQLLVETTGPSRSRQKEKGKVESVKLSPGVVTLSTISQQKGPTIVTPRGVQERGVAKTSSVTGPQEVTDKEVGIPSKEEIEEVEEIGGLPIS